MNEVALLCMRSEIHQELYFTVCPAVGTFGGYLASCAVKRTPAGKGSERKYLMKSDCWDHCTGRAGETEPEGKLIKNRRKVLKESTSLMLGEPQGTSSHKDVEDKETQPGH